MNNLPNRLLTAKQVAEMVNIPESTLKKNFSHRPSSVPPGLKLGNSPNSPIRWREKDVNEWIEQQFKANNLQTTYDKLGGRNVQR